MKIGLLGAGDIAAVMARTVAGMTGMENYAVASRDLAKAEAFAAAHGVEKAYGSYEEMLADPEISVRRFFDRPDREKQFLYRLIMEEPDPEKALENFRQCLMRINSRERYDRFLHSGFPVLLRDENRSIEQTVELAERSFGLA